MPTPSDLITRRSPERRSPHVSVNATCPQGRGQTARSAHTQYAASLQINNPDRESDSAGTRRFSGKSLYDEKQNVSTDTAMAIDDQSTSSEEEGSSFRDTTQSASTSTSTSTSPGVVDCPVTTVGSYFDPPFSTTAVSESLEFPRKRVCNPLSVAQTSRT